MDTSSTSSAKVSEKSPMIDANQSDCTPPSGTTDCNNSFISATSSIQKNPESKQDNTQTNEIDNEGGPDSAFKGGSNHMETLEKYLVLKFHLWPFNLREENPRR